MKEAEGREEYVWDKAHRSTDKSLLKKNDPTFSPLEATRFKAYGDGQVTGLELAVASTEQEVEKHLPMQQERINFKILIRLLITSVYLAKLLLLYFLFRALI